MAQRKVRHATVQYFIKNDKGDVTSFETAFRGMVVDIPEDQVERLDRLYATVPVDADLERPGRMLTLPDTAGDAEILSWVMGASNTEVEALVAERPTMAARILAAKESVTARFAEQNEHLGGQLQTIADEAETPGSAAVPGLGAEDNSGGTTPAPQASETPTPAVNSPGDAGTQAPQTGVIATLAPEQADRVVKGNAKAVTDYLSENPVNAAAVLEAEGRLAVDEGREPRVSVLRSAEAAAGFTQ